MSDLHEPNDVPAIIQKSKELLGGQRGQAPAGNSGTPNWPADRSYQYAALTRAVDVAKENWDIRPQPPVRSHRRVVGRILTLLKRLARKSIFWFVYPFIEKQAAYNQTLSQALHELRGFVRSASARLERLEDIVLPPHLAMPADSPEDPSLRAHGPIFPYLAFENKFRGSRETLGQRQEHYLKYFREARLVLDLGCGRGEFVELLRDNGIPARGVDISPQMVEECRKRGLDVELGDALTSLERLPDHTLDGVFSAQLVEHLLPGEVVTLMALAHRKLVQGGVLIVETINPLSLYSFLRWYQLDPTHVRPVHPEGLAFVAETLGYSDIRIEYLSPVEPSMMLPRLTATEAITNLSEFNAAVDRLNAVLFGPQDYALIAYR